MKLETIKSTLTGLLKDQAYFAILFGSVVTPYFRMIAILIWLFSERTAGKH
ncbi:MAG: hypothetical protein H6629_22850 [Calditrichae bacterium]|nr:hypothetical protein [Calditrichia bacterium]